MDGKKYLIDKTFCPLPWTGFIYEPDGSIKNCIVSKEKIGDLKESNIHQILNGTKNLEIKNYMCCSKKHNNCEACYTLEENKKSLEIISSRIYYLKELKKVPFELYKNNNNFDLKHCDIRWTNACNFSCVYCSPEYSSKWAKELKVEIPKPSLQKFNELKKYVYDNITNLTNVYLAGGEPLLMKENEDFLQLLLEKNPEVTLRVNTNLSKTKTNVFNLLTKFQNVHWTVSVEAMEKEFEYIRFGGKWYDFLDNLKIISQLNHKISFNMLWFILNFKSVFNTIEYFQNLGFHNNSFVIGPVLEPLDLNIRNLPKPIKKELKDIINKKISKKPGFLLEDGYKNILNYISDPFEDNITDFYKKINELDKRRGTNFISTFPELYSILQKEGHNYG